MKKPSDAMAEDLFNYREKIAAKAIQPLAERMRPRTLAEFAGQAEVVGEGSLVRKAIENGRIFSLILWGPPGCGKTTLARIIARESRAHYAEFSAVLSGVREIRSVVEETRRRLKQFGKKTVLFVDEIHRFNKAQQDAFLPHVESGLITLIGSTTENPSFEVIAALMSRCRVLTLKPLEKNDLAKIVRRAAREPERGLGHWPLRLTEDAVDYIAAISDGDARAALNNLEAVASMMIPENGQPPNRQPITVELETVEKVLQRRAQVYDKSGEGHFNLISAFHKSMRGGDPDASLYWLCRMLEGGEDPFYILRRMVRFASEDIGNADPEGLQIALNAMEAYRFLGSPEGDLAIAQAAVYLACAPKSNSVYKAFGHVAQTVKKTGSLPVPLHLRNAPTSLMKGLGYGKGYRYAHDYSGGWVNQQHLPDALVKRRFYHPSDRGQEKGIRERMHRQDGLKPPDKNDT